MRRRVLQPYPLIDRRGPYEETPFARPQEGPKFGALQSPSRRRCPHPVPARRKKAKVEKQASASDQAWRHRQRQTAALARRQAAPRRWRRHSGGTAATAEQEHTRHRYSRPFAIRGGNDRHDPSRYRPQHAELLRYESPTKIWTSPVRRMWTLNAILASSMHRFLGTKSRAPRPRIGASEVKAASRRRRTAWWGVVICAGLSATTAADARAETYAVLIRQIGGSESVPAHLVCEEGRVCLGQMSLSVEGGHRRIFIRGLIDGPYAYFKFRSDTQSLQCGSLEFITFQIAAPPNSTHYESGICDPPASAQLDAEGLRLPVLKSLPAFTTLRIDVRLRHNEALNR